METENKAMSKTAAPTAEKNFTDRESGKQMGKTGHSSKMVKLTQLMGTLLTGAQREGLCSHVAFVSV